jgi:CrcB protein
LNQLLLIGFGSALGGILRYWMSQGVQLLLGRNFPYGTLSINLLGCFIMGLLFVLILAKLQPFAPILKPLLLIGFLGGFTTFSSFSMETLVLFADNAPIKALLNIALSLVGCLGATWLGGYLAKIFIRITNVLI